MSVKPTVRVGPHPGDCRISTAVHDDRPRHTISRHKHSGGSAVSPMDDAEMG